MSRTNIRSCAHRRAALLVFAALLAAGVILAVAGGAPAQDLQTIESNLEQSRNQLDAKQAQLQQNKERQGVLSTTIQRAGDRLDNLRGQVATLRNQIAIVQTQLRRKEAELKQAKAKLARLRARLKEALKILRQRLIDIYESNSPSALTVILNAHGFNDLLSRHAYLQHIQSQDTEIAVRVKRLRNEEKETVERIRAAKNKIADKKAELEQAQA